MTEALNGLQWAVGVALALIAVLTVLNWAAHKNRIRGYLALAVGQLGVLGILGRFGMQGGALGTLLVAVSLFLLMGSALAFVLFADMLVPFRPTTLRACTAAIAVVTLAGIAVNLGPPTTKATGVSLGIDLALLLTWCVVVAVSIVRLWRESASLPVVQRARLRSLSAGFTGLVIAILAVAVSGLATENLAAEIVIEGVVLLSMPLLAASFTPPGWLRRIWREREEVQLRLAINDLLLYSPDEATLANRALEWAERLLGGTAALLALNGDLVAVDGLEKGAAQRLHDELQAIRKSSGLSYTAAAGITALAPIRSKAGEGYLAVLGGPFTPLFGEEELGRLGQYAVSITVALDRVHLAAGVRRTAELLDLAYDAILAWDFASGKIQYWNRAAAELYGFSAQEAVGRDPMPLLNIVYPQAREAIIEALCERDHWEGELEHRTKDGRVLPISARWALQRDASGTPTSVLEINRDITADKLVADELRRARDLAEQASTAKSDYLSRMSHELRTPLAAMLGFSDLLEMREPRDDQMQAIEAIQRAGSHLLSLVNDVLDIARIESGKETLSLEPVGVKLLIEECIALVSEAARERPSALRAQLDGLEELHVRADRQRLAQVLLNLLSNAIKYGAAAGTVDVTVTYDDAEVEISISDDGPGVPEAEQHRLFQPFERLGAERSTVQGTGLGLALSRQLAAAMGGTVSVVSEAGKGATFSVRLERATLAEPAAVVTALGPAVLGDGTAERTVLYVEDNLATVGLVESIFALRPNCRLITVMQGGMAVDVAREQHPDLVILDLHLPDINGDEVMRRLRTDPRTADIPVVMYSADATERQVERILAEGAVAYMTKPARVAEFLALLDQTLGDQLEAGAGG